MTESRVSPLFLPYQPRSEDLTAVFLMRATGRFFAERTCSQRDTCAGDPGAEASGGLPRERESHAKSVAGITHHRPHGSRSRVSWILSRWVEAPPLGLRSRASGLKSVGRVSVGGLLPGLGPSEFVGSDIDVSAQDASFAIEVGFCVYRHGIRVTCIDAWRVRPQVCISSIVVSSFIGAGR